MIKVFIGGSRSISRLNPEIRSRLDEIIRKQLFVIVGDANGADKAVQRYFFAQGYDRVEVFCTEDQCRNNLGHWKVTSVPAPRVARRSFEFYSVKDQKMAEEGSVGLMLWDGKSRGTLSNAHRLLEQGKKVVIWIAPQRKFETLGSLNDWHRLAEFPSGHLVPGFSLR
jgi:hypothetical protein